MYSRFGKDDHVHLNGGKPNKSRVYLKALTVKIMFIHFNLNKFQSLF